MMDVPNFRSYAFIRWRTATETFEDLSTTFPDLSPGRSTVFGWVEAMKKGSFTVEKGTSSGRPRETRTPENISRVRELIEENPRLSTYEVAAELSLPQSSILKILTDDLQFKNVLSVWVPHQLTDSNKMERVKCCRALIQLFKEHGFEFLGSHMFVQDETWVLWDSKPRREVWIPQDGQKPTTPHPKLTKRKTMVLMGFTCCPKRFSVSILHPGTTADRNVMIQYLKDTGHRFNNLKKNKIKLGELMLMWGNAKPHSAHKNTGLHSPQRYPASKAACLQSRFKHL